MNNRRNAVQNVAARLSRPNCWPIVACVVIVRKADISRKLSPLRQNRTRPDHLPTSPQRVTQGVMSEHKHTPGPWQWSLSGPGPTCKIYHKTIILGEIVLARILASHDEKLMMPSLEVAEANARLIAAAPELLEAAKIMRERIRQLANDADHTWNDWPESYFADAAIAKAEPKA